MKKILFLFLGFIDISYQSSYSLSIERINNEVPSLQSQLGQSNFTYNYNPSYIPIYDEEGAFKQDALLVRSQQGSSEWLGPSVMPFAPFTYDADTQSVEFEYIDDSSIAFESQEEWENYGTEDPRVAYRPLDKTYYMMYSAVQQFVDPPSVAAMLSLASTQTPWDKSSWTRHGFVFPTIGWSKSGALLFRDEDEGPHYLIWGDNWLTMATSDDLTTFTNLHGKFIETRADYFDSYLVESGPPPLKLSDGNYLFFYNSARDGYPSSKPGYALQYNVGWVILDGTDPSKILQRSDEPLLSPELAWEIGTEPYLGLVPRVVFLEAAKALGDDKFLVFYGGADSVLGQAVVEVKISASSDSFLQ